MKELTKAYKCDHCGRILATKAGMARHETCCKKNPKNHSRCSLCEHLKCERQTINYCDYDEEQINYSHRTKFYCEKRQIYLYHPKVTRMAQETREQIMKDAEMMPSKIEGCKDFQEDFYKYILPPIFEKEKKCD